MDSQYDPKSTMITTTISQVSRTTRNVVRFCTILLLFCCCSSLHTTNASAVPHPVEMGINNAQTEIGLNITKILNTFFASGVYDKRVRPNYAGPPVKVGVTMYIISISSVSEVQMDFTSDFYFRQGWRDPRLSFKPRPGIDALFVGAEVADRIWNPDTFFANEKSAQFHLATTPNTFIRISANGDVLRSTRLTVTSSCAMNLQYFPMDRQMCTIEVESYGYSMSDIMYNWGIDGKGSASIADNVELPQFNINGLKQNSKVEVLNTGNYSRLICEIEFVRSMGYYLIQIYIPASLIVIISWVSFWLHRNASPARVQLGVTTVLTMTTLMSSTNAALPKISYIKSIDVYLGTCFVMVFASLLEYATVGYMGKRIAMRKSRSQQLAKIKQRAQQIQQVKNSSNVEIGYHSGPPHMAPHHPQHAQSILGLPLGEQVPSSGGPSPRQRNSIANAPEMRYRMIGGPQGLLPPHAQQQQQQQQPQLPEKGRPSFDFSKKKISLAPAPDSDTEEGGGGAAPGTPSTPPPSIPVPGSKNQNSLFGVCPSDIDKYSRVVFPVCFLCFNLMYWIIYMHISAFLTDENDES